MTYPFNQAKSYSKGRGKNKIKLIVVHTMETPETPSRARQVWNWFAGKTAPHASAHYMVDNKEILQSVKDEDTAWAVADSLFNQTSISIEHAGQAKQTAKEWDDAYSKATLKLSAKLAAELCKAYNIPVVKLTPKDILAGKSGFCGHNDITQAKKIVGGHTDPGKNFPWEKYLELVNKALSK